MQFTDLPLDVLKLFFDHLVQIDVKQVRLVCRSLHGVVNSKLRFDRVFLSPNRANIDAFRGIAANEEFRAHVREIVWDDTRLEYYEREDPDSRPAEGLVPSTEPSIEGGTSTVAPRRTLQQFKEKIIDEEKYGRSRSRMKTKLNSASGSPGMTLDDIFDLYNQLYDNQQKIVEAGEDVETLALGLLSFPALKRLTISSATWGPHPLFPKYETPLFRSLPQGFVMPRPWPWLERPRERIYKFREGDIYKNLVRWDMVPEEWRGYHIAVDRLLATSAHHNVKELIIDTHSEQTGISHQIFTSPDSIAYLETVRLFDTIPLTTLELSLNVFTADQSDFSCFHNGLLKQALSKLTALEHLVLRTSLDVWDLQLYRAPSSCTSLDEIIPVESWATQLKTLKLCQFFLRGESVYKVLSNLRRLSAIWFDSVDLFYGEITWRDLVHRFKRELVDRTGTWKPENPQITWETSLCRSFTHRVDCTAALREYLHGEGECPFPEQYPYTPIKGWTYSIWYPEERTYDGYLLD